MSVDPATTEPVPSPVTVGPPGPDGAAAPHVSGRRIGSAVLVQLVGRVLGMAASVVTVAVTTRYLGVHDYGLLTTAVVFVGLWTSFTELGVGAVIVRRVAAAGDRELGPLVGLNLGISLVYCVPLAVVVAVIGLLVYHDQPGVHRVLLVVCGILVLTAIANCFAPVFAVYVRFTAVAAADAIARVVSLAATLVVAAAGGGLVWFGVIQLLPFVVQIVVLGIAARRMVTFRPRVTWAAARSLLRESLPQTGVLIVAALYWRADAVLLTLLADVREVGIYGLAYTVAFTLSVLSSFFLASTLSTMAVRFRHDRENFVAFTGSAVELMLFLGVPLAVFGGVLAHPVVALLSNRSFAGPAAVPLTVLLAAVALTFLTGVLGQALFAADDAHFLLRLNVVNLVVNIGLNLVLIPLFGPTGAAVALLASEASGTVITIWRLHRTCGFGISYRFVLRLLPPLAIGTATALLLDHVAHVHVLISIVVTGVVYLGASLVLGPVGLDRLRALREQPNVPAAA